MHDFPHRYRVFTMVESPMADVVVRSAGLPDLPTAPPAEFDGPGNRWSPETLLMAAVCDCFVLSFKAIAAASRLEWRKLDVHVEGLLERIDRRMRFTEVTVKAELAVPAGTEGRAPRVLEKAEESCLISNSLSAVVKLESSVVVV
jgi:organic hydroperoxide reductase OsmC/OhrA